MPDLLQYDIDISGIAVYYALALHAKQSGVCWPSIRTIQRYSKCKSKTTVIKQIARLEELGLIRCDRRQGQSTKYTLEPVQKMNRTGPINEPTSPDNGQLPVQKMNRGVQKMNRTGPINEPKQRIEQLQEQTKPNSARTRATSGGILARVNRAVDESPERRRVRQQIDRIVEAYNAAIAKRATGVRQTALAQGRDPDTAEPPMDQARPCEQMTDLERDRLAASIQRVGLEIWLEGIERLAHMTPRVREVYGVDSIYDLCRLSAEDRKVIAAGRSGEDRGPYIYRLASGEFTRREGESIWRQRA